MTHFVCFIQTDKQGLDQGWGKLGLDSDGGYYKAVGEYNVSSEEMFDFFASHVVVEGDYKLEEIRVQQELGRGNAHVYTANIRGETLALKQIEIKNDYEYQSFLKEITFMKELSQQSQWFVQYRGYLVTKTERNQYDKKKYAFIVMECAEINLEQFLTQRRDFRYRLRTPALLRVAEQILSALASLEELHIAHCDIKPENILIMQESTLAVKLCDVGSCKVVSKESLEEATILGTVPFLAPELVRTKSHKVASTNPFKSDLFSFGLVLLYMLTLKKFKSHERLDIDEQAYRQVILEWMKEARELTDGDPALTQLLRQSLEFDEFRRPSFKSLRATCASEVKKRLMAWDATVQQLEKDEECRMSRLQETYFSSQPSNQLNLFRSRKIEKVSFTKTTSNGASFKISRSRVSQSPVKRTISCVSSSPDKTEKGVGSMRDLLSEMGRVIYIGEENRMLLPERIPDEGEKYFVLAVPQVRFRRAQSVTLLPSCTYDVFYDLEDVQSKRLYIQSMDKEALGVPLDAPVLRFSKVRANLSRCDMLGGFEGLFRIIANDNLELLELRLTETEISMKEVLGLLDRLASEAPFLQTFLLNLERRLVRQEQHSQLLEKVARLPLKKLSLLMNECYIQCQKPTRWPLPRNCQILHLDYSNNLLRNIVNNLSISLASSSLKELFLSFENNALTKGQVHMLIKAIGGVRTLERATFNFAFNKIEELKYLETALMELLTLNYLELRLQRTEVPLAKMVELIDCLKELFEFALRMLKVSCDRNMPLQLFRNALDQVCSAHSPKGRVLRADVVGFDNHCFTAFLKKNDKGHSTRAKGGAAAKRSPKEFTVKGQFPKPRGDFLPKAQTMTEGLTMGNFTTIAPKTNASLCYQFYTSSDSFHNYLCVTCCELKEMSKYMHYCKFCLSNCAHKDLKDHYFVKVSESTRCVCAYSGCCRSDSKPAICGDKIGASLKKEYQCLKCLLSYCIVCVQSCLELHKEWVKECKELSYFRCKSKLQP